MKPLAQTLRKRILWILFFVFLVLTPILIGYSKGYRLDDALGLIQTGGIYLHSDVSNTSVFLDDEFVENNGAFIKNTLIQDLLPNRYYAVRVEREGYQSWVKVLSVKPNLVTEARVLMLPSVFDWKTILATTTIAVSDAEEEATTTEDVPNPEYEILEEFFLEDKDQFETEVATSTYEYIRGVRYASTTTVTEIRFPEWMSEVASSSMLLDKEMVREREGIVTWLENGDIFAVWGRENDPAPYYFCAETCVTQLAINWAEPIVRYEFYPNRSDVLVVVSMRGLYVIELDNRSERNLQVILEEPNLDFRFQSDGTLVVFDGATYRKTNW
jgi:hypothetical protein